MDLATLLRQLPLRLVGLDLLGVGNAVVAMSHAVVVVGTFRPRSYRVDLVIGRGDPSVFERLGNALFPVVRARPPSSATRSLRVRIA